MRRAALVAAIALAVVVIVAGMWLLTPDKPRAALEAHYAAAPSSFRTVLGLRLHLRDTGPRDAPAVILLHGFGSSLHTWEAWAGMLEADHRVIRLDLPGFGLTGADPTGDYTDARGVAVILALMDALGLRRAGLVGSSMGGRIAWTFAATHPDRVERLVLMAPDGFASPGMAYGRPAKVGPLLRVLPWTLPTFLLRAGLAPAYADPSALTEPVVARYRDMMLAPGVRRAIVARMEQAVLAEPGPLLRRIRAPTLLLWGERDAMIPAANAADYGRELPDSRVVILPGLGHVPQEEAPALSLGPVRAFLAR